MHYTAYYEISQTLRQKSEQDFLGMTCERSLPELSGILEAVRFLSNTAPLT